LKIHLMMWIDLIAFCYLVRVPLRKQELQRKTRRSLCGFFCPRLQCLAAL
jgi:hypothetical protein